MTETYVIHVTKLCNLKCAYCYEKDKTSTYTENEILELCKNIYENSKGKNFDIEFLGGEPMLAWDNIVSAYSYFEMICPEQVENYIITTNGTVLDDKQLNFIKNNKKIIFAISLDGHKWANQFRVFKKDGVNSYDTCMETISKAINVFNERLGIHMVIHKYNVAFLFDSFLHLYSKGIRNFGIGTIESTQNIDMEYCERFVTECAKISNYLVSNNIQDVFIDLFDNPKPVDDQRIYIKDASGKTIGESYGRNKDDLTSTNIYNSEKVSSSFGEIINFLRECVYENNKLRHN